MDTTDNNLIPSKTKLPSITLCCFSPPVMFATMVIEIGLAAYTLLKYRRGLFAKVVGLALVLLGVFQFSEYQICGGIETMFWSRFGLVTITLLPIIGLQLVSLINKKRTFLWAGYIITGVFLLFFVFLPTSVTGAFCGGNYIVFSGPALLYQFYGLYYFIFLLFAILESLKTIQTSKNKMLDRLLRWCIIGYLSFMLPMGIAYTIYAPARTAVASIMCGFAVILAFILAFKIVPKYYEYIDEGNKKIK